MSIYDNIKTAKDLVFEVMAHGLSTKQEDICRAQDIFGRSTVGELEALATDGRREKVFYQIIFTIWNREDATKYYNEHSNPLYIEGRKAVKERDKLEKELARERGEKAEIKKSLESAVNCRNEITEKYTAACDEILRLKAKLYDLMEAKGGAR